MLKFGQKKDFIRCSLKLKEVHLKMFNDIYPSLEFLRYRVNIDHNNLTFCDVDIETTVFIL